MIIPGSSEWEKLKDPRDRYKVLNEAMREEARKSLPNLELYEKYARNREAYRAACVRTLALSESRAWDAAHNIHVVLDGLGKARKYQQRSIQRMIAKFIDERRHRQIWAIIWKYRQGGVSTKIAEEFYLGVARDYGQKALVVAQTDPEATVIFEEKYRFMHQHDPLAPRTQKANETELSFPDINAFIRVRSAGGRKGVARGGNNRYVHLSEAAWYAANAYGLVGGILQGVTHPQAMVFMESTANGQAGMFYETAVEALEAEAARREGRDPRVDTKWEYIFLPWFLDDEAKDGIPFTSEEAKDRFVRGMRDDEKLLEQEFGLTPEQMHWYRTIFDTKIKGETHDAKLMLIQQEYPSRPLDAFVAPGSSAFDMPRLVQLALKAKPPIWEGDIAAPAALPNQLPLYDVREGKFLTHTPMPRLTKREGGPLKIWKRPVDGHRYYWGWDLAESGSAKADSTEGYCIDADTEELVAAYSDKATPNLTLAPCRMLSRHYNDATINVETNFAPSFVHTLRETDRLPFLFWRRADSQSSVSEDMSHEYGWKTTQYTKKTLVYLLREKLETAPALFVDKALVEQLKTFKQVQTPEGAWKFPGALPGSGTHDDKVIALALAIVAIRDRPPSGPPPDDTKDDPKPPGIRDAMKGHIEWEQTRNSEVWFG